MLILIVPRPRLSRREFWILPISAAVVALTADRAPASEMLAG
ncbi:MAG: hypothetical protein ACK5LS_00120 [Propioniciclava sp.]